MGFDAFLAGDSATAAWQYETAAQMGYEVAMLNAAWLYDHDADAADAGEGGEGGDGEGGWELGWLGRERRHAKARRLLLMAHGGATSYSLPLSRKSH